MFTDGIPAVPRVELRTAFKDFPGHTCECHSIVTQVTLFDHHPAMSQITLLIAMTLYATFRICSFSRSHLQNLGGLRLWVFTSFRVASVADLAVAVPLGSRKAVEEAVL